MNGPTICRLPCGSARRTANPSPRSRVRGTMIRSSASQVLGSPSTGSLEGCQLMGGLLQVCGDHSRNRGMDYGRWPLHVIASVSEAIHGAANTAMLSDPGTARYITPDGIAITTEIGGWRNAAVISGHWALHGFGMFAVEEKSSSRYIGRVGPWCPPGWPGFEVGWGIDSECRGKGYAVEAAQASIDWVFATFEIGEIIHCIEASN